MMPLFGNRKDSTMMRCQMMHHPSIVDPSDGLCFLDSEKIFGVSDDAVKWIGLFFFGGR